MHGTFSIFKALNGSVTLVLIKNSFEKFRTKAKGKNNHVGNFFISLNFFENILIFYLQIK
jgi:hypothetical protein